MREQWRAIEGYQSVYEVSNLGRIKSCAKWLAFTSKRGRRCVRRTAPKFLALQTLPAGYRIVQLHLDGQRVARTVHSLVAAAFIGSRPEKYDIAHYDGNPANNRADNLRYATRRENHRDKIRHGTHAHGSRIKQAKLREQHIPTIRGYRGRLSAAVVGALYGVSPGTIERVWRGVSWRYV